MYYITMCGNFKFEIEIIIFKPKAHQDKSLSFSLFEGNNNILT